MRNLLSIVKPLANAEELDINIMSREELEAKEWANWEHSWSIHQGETMLFGLKDGKWESMDGELDLFYYNNGDCREEEEGLVKNKTFVEMYGNSWDDIAVLQCIIQDIEIGWESTLYTTTKPKKW